MAGISSGVSQRIVSIHCLYEIKFPPITQHVSKASVETLQNDAFPVGETVSDVGEIVTRITGRQMKVSPCKVYPEFLLSVAMVHGEFFHVVSSIYSSLLFHLL